ncbi:MAG: 3-deoxy-7-phosphoheptulonate synthase [Bacteroidetes bacterium]|nr:MAG: 3-deoxy-7-phosphoheptulonate synthase [Bacteroidota bacterium]
MQKSYLQSRPVVIAGPCSAETREQVISTARALKGRVNYFRAGIWKPRTRPNAFEGVGTKGLPWLVEVQKNIGIPVMTEVANAHHAELALQYGLDAVWIGARTTVSPFAVQTIADALRGSGITVLVKNPMHADLKLWMGAIERLENTTKGDVHALHRGFSSYGLKKFRNAPMWEIPIGLKAEMPDIQLFCDPSHICGRRELLQSVSQKAMDLGMAGLMIESHEDPSLALSDAEQQLTPFDLVKLLDNLNIRDLTLDDKHITDLRDLRIKMDSIDEHLVELLSSRMSVAQAIGEYKKENGLTVLQLSRWREIMKTRKAWSEEMGLQEEFLRGILEQVHKESIRIQSEILNSEKK